MSGLNVNCELLQQFEQGLDPRFPEKSQIPARVLGYGEISTVLEIAGSDLAYKRMPMFRSAAEAASYIALYEEYVQTLQDRIGLRVIPSDIVRLGDEHRGRIVVYIVQEKLPAESIGHKAIHHISANDVTRLVLETLRAMRRVFDFNAQHRGQLELGFDGQISNWAISGFDAGQRALGEQIELVYFDTSAPLLRKNGKEQLNPELFLRSAPSFLVWVIRWLFLEEVMTRYYDWRRVAKDLIANFYKEGRPELILDLVNTVNEFFTAEARMGDYKPITVQEVAAYYREDAFIWRFYLQARKIDRVLQRLMGKDYPYILPAKIQR